MKESAPCVSIEDVASEAELHLALGMFDGVHLGHQAVIGSAIEAAREQGGRSGVLTFDPHPSRILRPDQPTLLVMPVQMKAEKIKGLGAEIVIVKRFTREFAQLDAEDFAAWLKGHVPGVKTLHVGENFRFGRKRAGDAELLERTAGPAGFSVRVVPRKHFKGAPVSSTRVRNCLSEGEIEEVNRMLGAPYCVRGRIRPGAQLGRQMGFPTLNIQWSPELLPRFGVYVACVHDAERSDKSFPAVANYGVRPTVAEKQEPLLEAHVLGPCDITAGTEVDVELLGFLRPEKKFGNVDELKEQIARDRLAAEAYFQPAEDAGAE